MKNTFLATLIAMLFALSFVSCDNKDDNPWTYRDRFYVKNISSYFLAFDGESRRFFKYDQDTEFGLDELWIAKDKWTINGISIKYGPFGVNPSVKDSILELKDYTLYPSRHETVKNDTIHLEYRDHHYEFTDSVLRDMKDSMKVKGILPKVVEE